MTVESRLKNIEKRLKALEQAYNDNQGSLTEVLGKDKKGQLIFGKTVPMQNKIKKKW